MSLQFNDTSTYKGLVQIYEKEIGANRGDVSGDSNKLLEFAADANIAMDDFTELAIKSSGSWDFDDSNQTDYPIITTNLVANQRDYAFTSDGSSNLILEVKKVAVLLSAAGTFYQVIDPVDVQTDSAADSILNGLNVKGVPWQYDKTANGIFLDPIPNYSATNGLKVYISRESTYFTGDGATGSNTKKPGVPGLFHKYFAIKPAMEYARRKNLLAYQGLATEVADMEARIKAYFGRREKDLDHTITTEPIVFI